MSDIKEGTDPKSVVLVGIDFSTHTREILQAAEGIAAQAGSELHLVHVLPLPPGETLGAGMKRPRWQRISKASKRSPP